MKKKFIFTKESSFTHLKTKMHQEVTEHIIEDDETKRLYHHVVSYGSWFRISYSSIFMAHILKQIGLTGFGLAYAADESQIILPCYPYHRPETKSIVELPKGVLLKDITFEYTDKKISEKFKQTFLGKSYKLKYKTGKEISKSGEGLLKLLFGCVTHRICEFIKGDECYPFYCILSNMGWYDKEDLIQILSESDVLQHQEIKCVLEKFVKIDIAKSIKILEEETQAQMPKLTQELLERQQIIREHLTKKQEPFKAKEK